eukprot:4905675-Pleurochrysis_carterae.AAC.1
MISALIKAGVNIFRLNSSHRQKGQFEDLVPFIREEVTLSPTFARGLQRCAISQTPPVSRSNIFENAICHGLFVPRKEV